LCSLQSISLLSLTGNLRICDEIHIRQIVTQGERPRIIGERVAFIRHGHDVEVANLGTLHSVIPEGIRDRTVSLPALGIHHRNTSATDTITERVDRPAADRRRCRRRRELRVPERAGNDLSFLGDDTCSSGRYACSGVHRVRKTSGYFRARNG